MNTLTQQTLTEAELKELVRLQFVPLASKDGCSLFARLLSSNQYIYILKIRGRDDYWTSNESQAVETYNNAGVRKKIA